MRKIIHIDMDCFFAAVEMRDNPALREVPLAIGGSADRRGVISTCNYVARRFGVRSAMPSALARKLCPPLVLIPGRMAVYKEVSRQLRAIFLRYTEQVEPVFNTVAGVRRTALVGVGALGQQVPVLCYELLPDQHFHQVEAQLQALALQHPELGGIEHFLRHPGFPVDIRHNAKIGREKLAVWAQAQLG